MTEAEDYDDHTPSPWPRLLARGAGLAVAYPLALLAALYGQWLLSWAALGHPPRVSIDDPKDIRLARWLMPVVGVLILGLLPTGLLAVLLVAGDALLARRRRRLLAHLAGLLVLWPATIALLRWDPGRVVEWWVD